MAGFAARTWLDPPVRKTDAQCGHWTGVPAGNTPGAFMVAAQFGHDRTDEDMI
jgi:hypothetical protein